MARGAKTAVNCSVSQSASDIGWFLAFRRNPTRSFYLRRYLYYLALGTYIVLHVRVASLVVHTCKNYDVDVPDSLARPRSFLFFGSSGFYSTQKNKKTSTALIRFASEMRASYTALLAAALFSCVDPVRGRTRPRFTYEMLEGEYNQNGALASQ